MDSFSSDPFYIHPTNQTYKCLVCCQWLNGPSQYAEHLLGKLHKNNKCKGKRESIDCLDPPCKSDIALSQVHPELQFSLAVEASKQDIKDLREEAGCSGDGSKGPRG